MNTMKVLGQTAVALGIVLIANTEVSAAEVHHLKLPRPMVIASVDLRAAVYTVQWDLQGTRATVTFSRKGRVVATVQGIVVTFDRSVRGDTLYFSKQPDGYFTITALGFAGSDKGLIFPVARSHPHPARDTPLDKSLVEDSWPNAAPAVPRVYR